MDQGHGDWPKAGTSRASEAAQAKPCAQTGSVSLKFAFHLTLTVKKWPSEIEETGPG